MSNRKANVRIEKWRAMLEQGLYKDPELLRSRIYKGVPTGMRQIVWPEIVPLRKHIEQRTHDLNYNKLVNSFSNNIYEISLDVPRTFPEEEDSKVLRKSLSNVLKALSIVYPRIGYCQGMNFPTLRILQVLGDEETFWLLHYLFENDKHIRNNFIDPESINLQNYIFERLLEERSPLISKTLAQKDIRMQTYTIKWCINLYSGLVSQENFNRIFEVYLLDGWPAIYSIELSLIQSQEKALLNADMETCHYILGKKIYEIQDIDSLLLNSQKQNVTKKKLAQLEADYLKNVRDSQKFKSTSESQLMRREKKNSSQHRFTAAQENVGLVQFQNKAEEMNFDALYLLKSSK